MNGYVPVPRATSQRAGALRDCVSVMRISRWQPMARKLTMHPIDALAERGHCDLVAGPSDHADADNIRFQRSEPHFPEYDLRQGTSARPDWPSGLIGIESLPLIFPAEAYAAR